MSNAKQKQILKDIQADQEKQKKEDAKKSLDGHLKRIDFLKEKAKKQVRKQTYDSLVQEKIARMEHEALIERPVGNMALIHNNSFGWIEPVEVMDDSKLIHSNSKEVAIFEDSDAISVTINMQLFWAMGGLIQRIKFWIVLFWMKLLGMDYLGRLKFNLYRIEASGEYTLPFRDLTPFESKRRVEEYLKIANPADQGKALANMVKGLGDPEPWWKTGMWLISILLIIFMFLYVMNGATV